MTIGAALPGRLLQDNSIFGEGPNEALRSYGTGSSYLFRCVFLSSSAMRSWMLWFDGMALEPLIEMAGLDHGRTVEAE